MGRKRTPAKFPPAVLAQLRAKLPPDVLAVFRALGRKGGKARAKNMSAKQRSAGARKAARARWKVKTKRGRGGMKRWLVLGALILPTLSHAECGWLLMRPISIERGMQMPSIDQWRQEGAFDSAKECETTRFGTMNMWGQKIGQAAQARAMAQAGNGTWLQLSPDERVYVAMVTGRCLPSSQVPIR